MSPIKVGCKYCPPCRKEPYVDRHGWEMHPSWMAGMQALKDYNRWVERVVLPIAFQWIEEHKPEVYASVPEELTDDVGVVIAAAFRLVRELPAYQEGLKRCERYEAELREGKLDHSKLNPVWTGITKKIRACTKEAFTEQSSRLGDTIP